MGVKKLFTFLNEKRIYKKYEKINNLLYELKLNKNSVFIGIDTNLYFYKYNYTYDNIIIGFFNQIIKFLSNGIYPLYIIDGGTLKEKEKTNIMRNNKKKNNYKKIEELLVEIENSDDKNKIDYLNKIIEKLKKKTLKISNDKMDILIELFDLMNILYIFSYGEAEYLAVLLNNYGIIDFFLTDDTDPIPAGINNIIKFTNNHVLYLNKEYLLKELEINENQLCDFCILLGNDYNTFNIKKLKPFELLKLVKNNDITEILNIFNIDEENFINLKNIYLNSSNDEKDYILKGYTDNDNIINITYKNNSIILNQFWNELKEVLINNKNSLNLKKDIIKKIKKTKFKTDLLLNFLKKNINNITNDEIENIKITFSYLDNFR